MEALRKAEQQKQASQERETAGKGGAAARLELEPLPTTPGQAGATAAGPTPAAGSSRLPELPRKLEDLDEQFVTPAARTHPPKRPATRPAAEPPPPASNTADTATRATARALFEAKHPKPNENRSFAIAVGLLTLVASIGIGGYFWWQMQPAGTLVASGAALASPEPAGTPAPAAQTAAAVAPAEPAQAAAPATAQPSSGSQGLATASASPNNSNAPDRAGRETARPEPPPVQAGAVARPSDPIRITAAPLKLDPVLDQAFQAFQRGEAYRAAAAWQQVLASDPRNADALYGMAAVALQQGQPNQAADFYLRALEANPRDALALAGLLSLKGHVDPQQTESRLKNLLAEQADSPFLNFALGNLYANSTRWAEAQQAFFKAHVADPGNPDYLFNLAVSLDQLRQSRLAVQYYNQALAAAAQRQSGFDAIQVGMRLKILQSSQ